MIKLSTIKPNPNNPRIELKEITGFPSYIAGDDGFIYSKYTGLKLNAGITGPGYYTITLCENKKRFSKSVHRLIALAFYGESNLPVNHINGSKLDNRPANLEYCTAKQNTRHAITNGLLVPNTDEIATKKRKLIAQMNLITNEQIAVFESSHKASKETKINRGNICSCARNEVEQAGQFKWKYL